MVRIALTGTPATGKTTLAHAARAAGWNVVDATAWAREKGAVAAGSDGRDAEEVDVEVLADRLATDPSAAAGPIIYESHWSHALPIDEVWVLRCDPDILRGRLEARGYAPAKVVENLEAEAMDLILQEALAAQRPAGGPARVIQRDATTRSTSELLSSFAQASSRRDQGNDLEHVDWSDRLPIV